jgi:hypothetical protein
LSDLSDLSELVIGVTLMFIGIGSLIAVLPRRGKTAWFARMPILNSGVPLLMITAFVFGIILTLAYFTTFDDITLRGAAKHF